MPISRVLKREVLQSWVALQRTHTKSQLWLEVRVDANTAAVKPVMPQESLGARAHMSSSSLEKWRRPHWQQLPFILWASCRAAIAFSKWSKLRTSSEF